MPSPSIYLLAYISRSRVRHAAAVIDDIAAVSVDNNAVRDITGILLLNGNYFFQVLEGREDQVKELYQRIATDSRHEEIRSVMECHNDERFFGEWFMRAFNLDDYYDVDTADFRRRLNSAFGTGIDSKTELVDLLRSFKHLVIASDVHRKRR